MSKIDTGGAAYPLLRSTPKPDGGIHRQMECGDENEGMSLRDRFAVAALQGLYASDTHFDTIPLASKVVEAWDAAEAMIAEKRRREAST